MRRFSILLVLAFAACSSPDKTSSAGQEITCTTDPGTGVILACHPTGTGSGSDTGSGGTGTCHDIDEDGDGEPHDQPGDSSSRVAPDDHGSDSDDDDGDGIPNSDDCDTHEGEDDCSMNSDGAQLPYDVQLALGATVTPVVDAFAQEGSQPASIVSVTGADWRAAELSSGASFVVTQADCDHQGNRDIGRDRVVVTWTNADGTTASDHLDLRYCGH